MSLFLNNVMSSANAQIIYFGAIVYSMQIESLYFAKLNNK